jgi:hypothetical protein
VTVEDIRIREDTRNTSILFYRRNKIAMKEITYFIAINFTYQYRRNWN